MPTRFDFQGRKVVLTGAARGIGLELTRLLVPRGARIIAVGRDKASLQALRDQFPGKVETRAADLSQDEHVADLADWLAVDHRDCSALINNAAVMNQGMLTGMSDTRFQDIATEIATNLTAPLKLAAAMLPVLSAHQSALIANVTSGLAIAPKRDAAVYCATKAGLRSFTRSLRDQCRHAGLPIQVSEIVMTLVDTTLSSDAPRKYPPDRAASDMLRGLENGQDEVWIEKTRLLRVIHRLSPNLAYRIMRGR